MGRMKITMWFKNGTIIEHIIKEEDIDVDKLQKVIDMTKEGMSVDIDFEVCFLNIIVRGNELLAVRFEEEVE